MTKTKTLRELTALEREAHHKAINGRWFVRWYWRLEEFKWRDRRLDFNRRWQEQRRRRRKAETKE